MEVAPLKEISVNGGDNKSTVSDLTRINNREEKEKEENNENDENETDEKEDKETGEKEDKENKAMRMTMRGKLEVKEKKSHN